MGNVKVQNITRTPVENGSNWGSVAGVTPPPAEGFIGDGYFQDDFATGTMNTTANGFQWAGRKGEPTETGFLTSVIKQQDDNLWYAVWNNGDLTSGGATDGNLLTINTNPDFYDAVSGVTADRLKFDAYNHEGAEQGIYHGNGIQEVYMAYWLKIPDNFQKSIVVKANENNKWFQWWAGEKADYDNPTAPITSQVIMNTYPGAGTAEDLTWSIRDAGTDGNGGIGGGGGTYPNFFSEADAGKWMHIVYHFKTGVTDGAFEMWRRWEDESTYTVITSETNIGFAAYPSLTGLKTGYILGYTNRHYEVTQEFIMDNFELSLAKPAVLP